MINICALRSEIAGFPSILIQRALSHMKPNKQNGIFIISKLTKVVTWLLIVRVSG